MNSHTATKHKAAQREPSYPRDGERLLVLTAALGARLRRQPARDALTDTPPPEASP
jgi:hypothetical protein